MNSKTLYILPNALTTLNLFAGFLSVIYSIQNHFVVAAYAIIVAAFFDLLDGRIARLTKSTSAFGAEYDSLCDLVSFGIAPSLLLYQLSLHQIGRFGWLSCFFLVACGAIRLARFNVKEEPEGSKHFRGLPIPLAAGIVASAVLAYHKLTMDFALQLNTAIPSLILCFLLGVVMISNIKYRNFKDVDFKKKWPARYLAFFILLIIAISYSPEIMLFCFFLLYTILGIVFGALHTGKKILQNKTKPTTTECH
ncbi:MAG: CDP-diacylglycerol--serine O-phosphatidyltransferase [Bdellovibrionaceae bacterium]|nr:CDP-diacylglycerol--serine O-phosphatidyltransferase [Pseudobdellovibrionaceae bacterium]